MFRFDDSVFDTELVVMTLYWIQSHSKWLCIEHSPEKYSPLKNIHPWKIYTPGIFTPENIHPWKIFNPGIWLEWHAVPLTSKGPIRVMKGNTNCNICNKKFYNYTRLTNHKLTHGGEKAHLFYNSTTVMALRKTNFWSMQNNLKMIENHSYLSAQIVERSSKQGANLCNSAASSVFYRTHVHMGSNHWVAMSVTTYSTFLT